MEEPHHNNFDKQTSTKIEAFSYNFMRKAIIQQTKAIATKGKQFKLDQSLRKKKKDQIIDWNDFKLIIHKFQLIERDDRIIKSENCYPHISLLGEKTNMKYLINMINDIMNDEDMKYEYLCTTVNPLSGINTKHT